MATTSDDESRDRHTRMYRMIMGYWAAQAVRALADLSVAEHLTGGALSAEQIAELEASDVAMTRRLLRAGVALELLDYDASTRLFSGTPLLSILHGDAPQSLKNYALSVGGPACWKPALYLPESVRTGRNHTAEALGFPFFDFLAANPADAGLFSDAMTDLSTPVIGDALPHIDAAAARSVVDIGGADGAFVRGLLHAHPHLHGTVYDLPHIASAAESEAHRHDLGGRLTGVGGDFFADVPAADIYLLKFILHDWSDDQCVTILSNIRARMPDGAHCYIAEMVVSEADMQGTALMDLAMLGLLDGQERELAEFDALLAAARLTRTTATALTPPYVLIEAVAS